MALKITFVKEAGKCGQYFVHEDTDSPADGVGFDFVKDAKKAAMAEVKADAKAARKLISAEKKAVNSAERATKAIAKAAEKAAEKLAAEEKLLADKKARLDAMNAAGTFSLVG